MAGRFLSLASNRLFWQLGDPFVWPYNVDLDFREELHGVRVDDPPVVWVSEGVAHGHHGGRIGVGEALTSKWAEHFVKAEAEWLKPYLERLARSEVVTEDELIAEFVRRHGREPEMLE